MRIDKWYSELDDRVVAYRKMRPPEILKDVFKIFLPRLLEHGLLNHVSADTLWPSLDKGSISHYFGEGEDDVDKYSARQLLRYMYDNFVLTFREALSDETYDNPQNMAICESCHTIHLTTKAGNISKRVYESTKIRLCGNCATQKYGVCPCCKKLYVREFRRGPRPRGYCDDCYEKKFARCAKCGEHVRKDSASYNEKFHIWLCPHCSANSHRTCTKCGDPFFAAFRVDNWKHEGKYCDSCLMKEDTYHSWQFRPVEFLFRKTKGENVRKDTLFLGIELEAEIKVRQDRFAHNLKKALGFRHLYVVHDGSMDNGIEVVPMPFTVRWYHKNRNKLKRLYDYMVAHSADFSGRRVGFHVHTSLAAWSSTQIFKLNRLIYGSYNPHKRDPFFPIYGRAPNAYCLYRQEDREGSVTMAKKKSNVVGTDHYNVLNMKNRTTLEFRMFAGPATFENMIMKIDFVISLYEYTNTVSMNNVSFNSYCLFLLDNKTKYRNIISTLLSETTTKGVK